jgi:hypothetical protein
LAALQEPLHEGMAASPTTRPQPTAEGPRSASPPDTPAVRYP